MSAKGARVRLITLYTRVLLHLAENPQVSQEMLARDMDVTMRTIQRHLRELEEEGYVRVDRQQKPYQYTIDWNRPWPQIDWLRLVVLHPEVQPALRGLSDVAARVYRQALADDVDTARALRDTVAALPEGVGAV